MLVTHSVFVEHFRHFLGDHVTVILNGYEWNFFSRLGCGFLWSGSLGGLGRNFWCVTHRQSIH